MDSKTKTNSSKIVKILLYTLGGLIIVSVLKSGYLKLNDMTKYDFDYGHYKKVDETDEFPFIFNVYEINEQYLSIFSYNSERKIKHQFGQVPLVWTTSKNGIRVGYNLAESQCVVYFDNRFYFQNGPSAFMLINDLIDKRSFDNSLFLNDVSYIAFSNNVSSELNDGLFCMTREEISAFNSAQTETYNEVVREIINAN